MLSCIAILMFICIYKVDYLFFKGWQIALFRIPNKRLSKIVFSPLENSIPGLERNRMFIDRSDEAIPRNNLRDKYIFQFKFMVQFSAIWSLQLLEINTVEKTRCWLYNVTNNVPISVVLIWFLRGDILLYVWSVQKT